MRLGDAWVLDSPVSNALGHFLNLALFLLGPSRDESAAAEIVDAELYRTRDIENYDTASLRLTLGGGVKLLVLLTHACGRVVEPTIRIRGDVGGAVWQAGRPVEIEDRFGQCVQMLGDRERPHAHMVERFARLVRGMEDRQRAVASLETARAHVAVVNAASSAALVSDVPAGAVEVVESPTGPVRAIAGIEQVFALCAASGQMLHECGRCAWAGPASRLTVPGGRYLRFEGPACGPRAE
jgi:predicted dehydrogenase